MMGMSPLTVAEAKAHGYAITSRRHRLASRLDRQDWRDAMAQRHGPSGKDWVQVLGDRAAADHYRRCFSKDRITVPDGWLSQLPNSGDGPEEFRP